MSIFERGQIYVATSLLLIGYFHHWQAVIDASSMMFLGIGVVNMIFGFKE
jgi:hypothetical protein